MILRKIQKRDNKELAALIRTVMTAYDCVGEGYSIQDPEIEDMYTAYSNSSSVYYILDHDGKVMGGGGIAALAMGDPATCELKKMYFYPEARGKGLGKKLLESLLTEAKTLGYNYCYLETVERMKTANLLYKKFGFEKLNSHQGNTGHCGCDTFYKKAL